MAALHRRILDSGCNAEYNAACDANWTACGEVKGGKINEIIAFRAFTYSADMLLLAIDLGQRSAWTPMWREIKVEPLWLGEATLSKWTLRAAAWAENILGVVGVIFIGTILWASSSAIEETSPRAEAG